MEQRSAAAFGGGDSSDDEDYEEGYEAEQLQLTVQRDDLQHEEPRLQTRTRGQRRLAGQMLVISAPNCKQRGCLYCTVKACLEAGEPEPCHFCSIPQRPDLCIRKGHCSSWTIEQNDELNVARTVAEALIDEEAAQQIPSPGHGDLHS